MRLRAALRVAVLAQFCLQDSNESVKLVVERPSDAQFAAFLGVLASRYLVSSRGGTLVLCLVDVGTPPSWIRRHLRHVPVMLLCPGSEVPPMASVDFMVAARPERVRQVVSNVQPASSLWHSNMMVVVRADGDGDPSSSMEPLVRGVMATAWSRSWGLTSVAVAGRVSGTLFKMAPFANASGVCGSQTPSVVPVVTVPLDRISRAALPAALYAEHGVVPRDLGGCVMRAALVVRRGNQCDGTAERDLSIESKIVLDIMMSVARYRNVRVKWQYLHDEKILDLEKGTPSRSLRGLAGDADVVLGALAATPSRIRHFRATAPFLHMPVRVMARCPDASAARPNVWRVVFDIMWGPNMTLASSLTVLGFFASVAVYLSIAWVAAVPPQPWRWLAVVQAALLDYWAKAAEVSATFSELCPDMWSARVLGAAWLLYVLNFNVAVKGLLFAESTLARSEPLPQSVGELVHAVPNLSVGVSSHSLRGILNESGVPLERIVVCQTQQEVEQFESRFEEDSSLAVAASSQLSRFHCLRGCRYRLKDSLVQASYVNFVRKDYLLVTVLDETIHRLHSGGVIDRLLHLDAVRRQNRASRSRIQFLKEQRQSAGFLLVMYNLYLVLIGLLLSTVVFLIEHVAHRTGKVTV